MDKQVIAFFHPDDAYGWMSNWFICDFTVDGKHYDCVERYMMYQKAILFGDSVTAKKILGAPSPAAIKRLGREVRGFDSNTWDAHKLNIVYTAVFEKFNQNDSLKKQLIATGDSVLAEANPNDSIWGIGVSEKYAQDILMWKGANFLGLTLMAVRWCLSTKEG